jgi:predicted transcriptional regulator
MTKRTTLTLEDDVVHRLEDAARRTGKPLKAVVNDAIRAGLSPGRRRARFRVESRPMGLRPGIDLDDIGGLLERIEGPEHR